MEEGKTNFSDHNPARTILTFSTTLPHTKVDTEPLPTYETAVREVLLRRTEDPSEREHRLASMVMSRWRMPMWRRIFEEALVVALQAVSEANEISRAMMTGIRFVVRLGCELPESRVLPKTKGGGGGGGDYRPFPGNRGGRDEGKM